MRKSILVFAGVLLLMMLVVGTVTAGGAKQVGNTVYVFGPTPDHGWTGSAARFAEEKIAELNRAGGKYTYVFKSAAGPDEQIRQIEQVLTESRYPAGIVIQCSDDAVQPAVEKIAQANIPLILFDRLVDDKSPLIRERMLVAMGADNYAVGAGIAYYFVEKGMMPGDSVWELPGDNSGATRERSVGFREFLLGTRSFVDDQRQSHNVASNRKWSQDQVNRIVQSQVGMWSRDQGKSIFASYIEGKTADTLAKWLFTHDDEYVMGMLEYLQTPARTAERTLFENNVRAVSGAGGLIAMYEVMARTKATAGNQLYQPDGMHIMSASVRPGFFVDAIQLMVEHLAGKDITSYYTDKAAKRYMEPTHLVDTQSYLANKDNPSWRGFD